MLLGKLLYNTQETKGNKISFNKKGKGREQWGDNQVLTVSSLIEEHDTNIKTTGLSQQSGTQSQTDHSDWENGLNDQIKTSVRQALDARELIKVTLLQNTDENIHEVAEILEGGNRSGYSAEDWPDLNPLQAVQQKGKSQTLCQSQANLRKNFCGDVSLWLLNY